MKLCSQEQYNRRKLNSALQILKDNEADKTDEKDENIKTEETENEETFETDKSDKTCSLSQENLVDWVLI